LHDEQAAFARKPSSCKPARARARGFDRLGFLTSFKATVIEGLEVVFIVIAVGATGSALLPAALGVAAAGLLVIIAGLAVHRPLSRCQRTP